MMRRIALVLILSLCLSSAAFPAERASAIGVGDLSNALQEAITQVRPAAEQALASLANLFQQIATTIQPLLSNMVQQIVAAVQNVAPIPAGGGPAGVGNVRNVVSAPPPETGGAPAPPKGENPPAPPVPPADGSGGKVAEPGVLDVPIVGQPDGYTCGPTSLCMALKFYKIDKQIHPDLCNLCGTTTNGTNSTVDIANAAKKIGLAGSYSKSGTIDWLRSVTQSGKPVVVNVCGGAWTGGHYIVVTGVKDGKVFINDPAWGLHNEYHGKSGYKYTLDFNTFSSIWSTRSNNAAVISL